jgi:hypothetical protein
MIVLFTFINPTFRLGKKCNRFSQKTYLYEKNPNAKKDMHVQPLGYYSFRAEKVLPKKVFFVAKKVEFSPQSVKERGLKNPPSIRKEKRKGYQSR